MLALHATPAFPHIALVEVRDPAPQPSELLVRVSAFSLNRGEVLDLSETAAATPLGWDFAGVVARGAEDGSGFPIGTRVVGIVRRGSWAELVAAPTQQLAVIPAGVSDAEAASLPTAGLTALRSLELAGSLLGRRVLITGATGGVGQYAVQLAALAGASVTALVRDLARGDGLLRRFGAVDVVAEIPGHFDLILDVVGGTTFAAAIEHAAPRGLVVNIATGDPDEIVAFRASSFDRAVGARIQTFNLLDELAQPTTGADLSRLVRLLDQRELVSPVSLEAPWEEIAGAIEALLSRATTGKIVLHVHDRSDKGTGRAIAAA